MTSTGSSKMPFRGVGSRWRHEKYTGVGISHDATFGRGNAVYPWGSNWTGARTGGDAKGAGKREWDLPRGSLMALSVAAGLIHLGAAFSHFSVSALHGGFFIATAFLQLATGLLMQRSRDDWVLIATASGNALIVAIWAMSRTTGIPIDPHPWTPESVGMADATASIFELALVVGSLVLLAPPSRSWLGRSIPSMLPRFALLPAGSAVLVTLTGLALVSAVAEDHGHGSEVKASAVHGDEAHAAHNGQALLAGHRAAHASGQELHRPGSNGNHGPSPTGRTVQRKPAPGTAVPSAPRVHRPVPAMNLPNNSSELEMGHTHDEHGSHHDEPNHGDVPH